MVGDHITSVLASQSMVTQGVERMGWAVGTASTLCLATTVWLFEIPKGQVGAELQGQPSGPGRGRRGRSLGGNRLPGQSGWHRREERCRASPAATGLGSRGGTAAIAVGGLLLGVDPNCSVVLGGPSDPGCMARSGGTEGVVTATAAPPLTVSGFVALSLGGAIVLLLIVFVVIVLVLEGTSHGTPLEDHDGVRIVCEDTKGTVPLEDCRSTTSSDVRRSGIHLEDTVPLKDRRATSHTGSTGGLVVLENPRVASLRSMGASPRDSGVDVGSNNDIKGAGTS
eukprot:Em0015g816a